MALYVKIDHNGIGGYIQPIKNIETAINGEMDGAEVGNKWTLEIIEMSDEDYNKLPEFEGY